MGVLRYCDWCQDEVDRGSEIEYHKKYDAGFTTIDKVCNTCLSAHTAFIKSIKQHRKPYVGYRK